MPETLKTNPLLNNQYRLLAIFFACIVIVLAGGYFAFLRFNFSPLYQGLTTQDAAIVVEELEAREVRYKLRNGGEDILVPFTQVASVRLAIIGSDAPTKNLSGFELFNDSQMGLTDFDQKIKYQRALQGELSRTIMMMDDVKSARVHIAIPERALFRASQSIPKAAVTIISSGGVDLSKTRITGIQQLVAASIPELVISRVVVINSFGEVISEEAADVNPIYAYKDALEKTYTQKAQEILRKEFPGGFSKVSINAEMGRFFNVNYIVPASGLPVPRLKIEDPVQNNYSLNVSMETNTSLSEQDMTKVKDVLKNSIFIDETLGDKLHFSVNVDAKETTNAIGEASVKIDALATRERAIQQNAISAKQSANLLGEHSIFYTVLGLLLLLLLVLIIKKVRHNILSPAEHLDFAEQLKLKLHVQKGQSNA